MRPETTRLQPNCKAIHSSAQNHGSRALLSGKFLTIALLFQLPALCGSAAFAQNVDNAFGLTYGAGLAAAKTPHEEGHDATEFFPILTLSYGRFAFDLGEGLSFTALANEQAEITVGISGGLTPDFPNTALFSGLNRKVGTDIALDIAHDFGIFDFRGASELMPRLLMMD